MNRKQLENEFQKSGVRADAYSLFGTLKDDAHIIDEIYGKWIVFYFERGSRSNEQEFSTENEACQYLLELLRDEPSVKL